MASKKNKRPYDEVSGDVNLSPMIDCCFLLLIFFVVNATAITVAKDPSIKMPNAVTCSELKDAKGCIVVNVYADAEKMSTKALDKYNKAFGGKGVQWSMADVNGKTTGYAPGEEQKLIDDIGKTKDILKSQKIDETQIRLYVRGDQNTPWERTAKAIQCAAQAGISNLVFGTLPTK